MKKMWVSVFLLIHVLLISTAVGKEKIDYNTDRTHCPILTAIVADPDPPLNVRSSPEILPDNIIGKLSNGRWLSIELTTDQWFQIAFSENGNKTGWVSRNKTEYTCSFFREKITLPTFIQGRIIGGGTHRYVFLLIKGQKFIIHPLDPYKDNQKDSRGFPIVTGPDEKALARITANAVVIPGFNGPDGQEHPAYKDFYRCFEKENKPCPTTWTWIVDLTGNYEIELNSSFKGFHYAIALTVEGP